MGEEVQHFHHYDPAQPTVDITLSKMSKGYQWEIKTKGMDIEEAQGKIKQIDEWMRKNYNDNEAV